MFQENVQQSREDYRLMKERSAETERQMQETDRNMREQSDELKLLNKNVTKNISDLGNRLGEFVKHAVAQAVVQLFQAQVSTVTFLGGLSVIFGQLAVMDFCLNYRNL